MTREQNFYDIDWYFNAIDNNLSVNVLNFWAAAFLGRLLCDCCRKIMFQMFLYHGFCSFDSESVVCYFATKLQFQYVPHFSSLSAKSLFVMINESTKAHHCLACSLLSTACLPQTFDTTSPRIWVRIDKKNHVKQFVSSRRSSNSTPYLFSPRIYVFLYEKSVKHTLAWSVQKEKVRFSSRFV